MSRFVAITLILFAVAPVLRAADDKKEHSEIMSEMQEKRDHVGVWQRYPIVGVPMIATPPKIDGDVGVREWYGAARLSRLLDSTKGMGVRDRSDIYLAYTPTHLYIAFQLERPDNARAPSPDKDLFELLFDTTHGGTNYFNVGASIEKIMWASIGPEADKNAWNPAWEYKARLTDFGWEGEMAIAFDQFPGMKQAPSPGTIWGADFVRSEHTPVDRAATWPFRGQSFHAAGNLGHMLFTGRPVAIRTEGIGWLAGSQQAGLKLLVSNFSDKPVTFDSHAELRKADKPIAMEYFPKIDSAMAENLPAAIGSTLTNEVTGALNAYPIQKENSETVTIEPDANKLIELAEPDEPGQYLVGFSLSENKSLVAAGLVPIDISVPLAISVESYLYSAQAVAYEVDLRRVLEKITSGKSSLVIAAKDPAGKVVAQEKRAIEPGAAEIAGALRFPPTPETKYTIVARIVNGEKTVTTNEEHLCVPPKPEWLGNQYGLKKFVPEPFVPIQASATQCKTLTSSYEFAKGALLPNIKVYDREILSAPIELALKSGDGDLPIKISKWDVKEKDDERIVYAFAGELGNAKATMDGTLAIEFDGFAWYRINIAPSAGGTIDLTSATLTFPLKKEYARFCTVGAAGPNSAYSGAIPAEGYNAPFSFAYWLGGVDGGVQFLAESQRGWSNVNPLEVTKITADDSGGKIAVRFVDKPIKIAKPFEWSFGMIPTPSRVKPKDWGKYAFYQSAGIVAPPERRAKMLAEATDDGAKWKNKRALDYYNGYGWKRDKQNLYAFINHGSWQEIFGYPGTFDPKRQQDLKDSVKWMHGEGIKLCLYAGWGMNTEAPEWKDYGMEMVTLPLSNSGFGTFRQDPSTLWQDWFVYKCAQLIKEYDIDGLFIDSATSPTISENYTEGMRWIDDAGKVRGSYPILASRQWLKRLYKLWHGELKEGGIIYNHNSPPAVMAIETFADVRCPSEYAQTHGEAFDQKFLDYFTAKNGGEQFGLYVEFTNKDWMGDWAKKKTNQLYAVALPLNLNFKAVDLYTNDENGSYALDKQAIQWVWAASKWVDRSTAEYLPWWRNAKYISTMPSDQVITAMWLQKGKKCLLVVSNLNSKPRRIDVALNPAEIGMSNMTAQDALTGEKLEVSSDGKLSLDVDFERYRLIDLEAHQ